MPEHTHGEAPAWILHRFNRPVLGVRRNPQALPDPPDSLVVVRLHRRMVAEQRPEPRSLFQRHVVLGERAGRMPVLLVADDLREVLYEVSPTRDIQHLATTAGREHAHVALARSLEERELGAIARLADAGRLLVRLLIVEAGIEIGAP